MNILDKNVETKFTIKKSKFYCFAFFVQSKDNVKNVLSDLKKKYHDASHICYAYILTDKEYYYSDGGEPSQTAGLPIYNAIKSLKLNYTLVVVARYFGGIKFGVGPLRTTFKEVTLDTLKLTKICPCFVSDVYLIKIPYNKLTSINKILHPYIIKRIFDKETVSLELVGDQKEILNKLEKLKITTIKVEKNRVIK